MNLRERMLLYSRFRTFVLTKDAANLEDFDRVLTQGFISGGVEPLTTALMDPRVAAGLNQPLLTKESFAEFVRDSREYAADDNLSIAVLVNPSGASDGWEVAGVVIAFLEGYISKNPEDREVFRELDDENRARWIRVGKAIPRGLDFTEKVINKYPWTPHLGGTLAMFDTKELLYGPDPITYQDNVWYGFMMGNEPKYQGIGMGSCLCKPTRRRTTQRESMQLWESLPVFPVLLHECFHGKSTKRYCTRIMWYGDT